LSVLLPTANQQPTATEHQMPGYKNFYFTDITDGTGPQHFTEELWCIQTAHDNDTLLKS